MALGSTSIFVSYFWLQRDIFFSVWEAGPDYGLQSSSSMANELSVDTMGKLYHGACLFSNTVIICDLRVSFHFSFVLFCFQDIYG